MKQRSSQAHKPGPRPKAYKIDLPFDEALGRLLSAKPQHRKAKPKPGKKRRK
jgi:hypothetical protein